MTPGASVYRPPEPLLFFSGAAGTEYASAGSDKMGGETGRSVGAVSFREAHAAKPASMPIDQVVRVLRYAATNAYVAK